MKLQIENNSTSAFTDLSSDVSSANGSAEVTDMLRRGIKAAQDGNRAEARHLLLQVTELEPKNENAWLWLASISEYPEELLIFLSNVLNVNPNNERALEWEKSTKSLLSKTFVQRGIESSKESQTGFARQSFLQAIVHDDQNEMAWLWLASIAEIVEEKKSHLQKVLNINPNNETALASLKAVKNEMAQMLLGKARVEAISGNNKDAEKMLDDILNHAPEIEDAWMLKCFLTDSFSEKMKYFEKVSALNPENETAVSCLAAMKSVMEKIQPTTNSDAVKDFDSTEKAADIEIVEEDVLDLNSIGKIEVAELRQNEVFAPVESFAELKNEEDISYTANEMSDFQTEDYQFSENSIPQFEAVEEVEENSPRQVESVEEVFEIKAEISEDLDDAEMDMAFSETQESVFEETQPEVEAAEVQPGEVDSVSEMPSYHEVVEESRFSAEDQEIENTDSEFQFDDEPTTKEQVHKESPVSFSEEISSQPEQEVEETAKVDETFVEKPKVELVFCKFCKAENEPQDFICHSCRAMLTISDVEMLLGYQEADMTIVQQAVEKMEIEHSIKNFDAEGLKMLGIGLLNLKQLRKGFEYLQEASYLNPNDVLLNSQVNSLAIRLSEIEEQHHSYDSMPKNKTVLVVDDSATVRKLISGKLEKCGLEVICAVDGMDALEKINESIPDLILLDITMPRMDGYQVCKMIRGNDATKEVPVVMISGKDGFFDKVRGRMAGTTGYITKPFGPETLMKTVEAYIE
jgi:twitching motility two-component system response regulator PilG